MNRIETLFQSGRRDLLSIYFCAGTPRPDTTADTIRALERHGVDLIEIGIPFSDPMADGPVIQRATTDALRHGMTLRRLFDDLTDIRRDVRLPLILMGYLNPILRFGFEAFCARHASGAIIGSRFVILLEEEGGDATRAIVRLKEAIGGPAGPSEVWPGT